MESINLQQESFFIGTEMARCRDKESPLFTQHSSVPRVHTHSAVKMEAAHLYPPSPQPQPPPRVQGKVSRALYCFSDSENRFTAPTQG